MRPVRVSKESRRCAPRWGVLAAGIIFVLLLPAQPGWSAVEDHYTRFDLVSNVPGFAPAIDSNLANPWGIARSPEGPWWVVNRDKGKATLYSGIGVSLPALSPLAVVVPVNPGGIYDNASPTGIVYNGTADFDLAPGVPAKFLFVTADGTIAGWSDEVDRYQAVLLVDNAPEAAYTGATIARNNGRNVLYAANFRQERVDAFGPDLNAVPLPESAFRDPEVPSGFAPYNIRNIGGMIYVAFAEPAADGRTAVSGSGLGYVDAFDAGGRLLIRLQGGTWMDAPWDIVLAPAGFGPYSGALLVGNSGSGRIAAFDPQIGSFLGFLMNDEGQAIAVPGLHGLGFGNNGLAGPETMLFFTAEFSAPSRGVFGEIISGTLPVPRNEYPYIINRPPVLPGYGGLPLSPGMH